MLTKEYMNFPHLNQFKNELPTASYLYEQD